MQWTRENLVDMSISKLISESATVHLADYTVEKIINDQLLLPKQIHIFTHGNLTVVADYHNELVICFEREEVNIIFEVYELRNVILNEARGLVISIGNGELHQYWFDHHEYNKEVW